ncbi:MAG: tRNA (adenosine(37)-N6)-dimethylallyltransferase MiaA [Chitinophagaceae bacterium]|nr:tRNA (adenosine(37)-N6)-dimethylallyltransferase MiaA [Chitinophagaceae bacterium]
MNNNTKTLIIIAGPTAVGKTSIAVALAQKLNTEIISADSRQCYKGMSIGTAQASPEEQQGIPHHFVACYDPSVAINAADFEAFALAQLATIFQTNDTAIVCGGTGLYIKALCEGLDPMPPIDPNINAEVLANYDTLGIEWLQQQLQTIDPEFAKTGEMKNPARMLRALAFRLSNHQSIIHFQKKTVQQRPFVIVKIGLQMPREVLYQRINTRVDIMMQQGLLQEAQKLYALRALKNLQTVGYRELFDFMDSKLALAQAIEKIKQHSRNYAKRQLTWFQKDNSFHWLDALSPKIIDDILAHLTPNTHK